MTSDYCVMRLEDVPYLYHKTFVQKGDNLKMAKSSLLLKITAGIGQCYGARGG